jgi:pyrimidine-nucleoside phosphorylase
MAVYFQGMSSAELSIFTKAMLTTGEQIHLDFPGKFLTDKHSTGGVGDKTTLILAPILACFDIITAKVSGRGLHYRGGTVEKLEAIKNFRFPQNQEELVELLKKTDIGIMGYTDKIVPLDKKLYYLRDKSATVASIPLIASSIMSKKLAIDTDGIVLDVKVGSGAFMKYYNDAQFLCDSMMHIAKEFGRKVEAVISRMDQPLGRAVGNSLEIIEVIETLKGEGPADLTELVYTLASLTLLQKGTASTLSEAHLLVEGAIDSGDALEHFKKYIEASGADPDLVDEPLVHLPLAQHVKEIVASKDGYIKAFDAGGIGHASTILGSGRCERNETINYGVGVVVDKKIGDQVKKGDCVAHLYYEDPEKLEEALSYMHQALEISPKFVEKQSVIWTIKR